MQDIPRGQTAARAMRPAPARPPVSGPAGPAWLPGCPAARPWSIGRHRAARSFPLPDHLGPIGRRWAALAGLQHDGRRKHPGQRRLAPRQQATVRQQAGPVEQRCHLPAPLQVAPQHGAKVLAVALTDLAQLRPGGDEPTGDDDHIQCLRAQVCAGHRRRCGIALLRHAQPEPAHHRLRAPGAHRRQHVHGAQGVHRSGGGAGNAAVPPEDAHIQAGRQCSFGSGHGGDLAPLCGQTTTALQCYRAVA